MKKSRTRSVLHIHKRSGFFLLTKQIALFQRPAPKGGSLTPRQTDDLFKRMWRGEVRLSGEPGVAGADGKTRPQVASQVVKGSAKAGAKGGPKQNKGVPWDTTGDLAKLPLGGVSQGEYDWRLKQIREGNTYRDDNGATRLKQGGTKASKGRGAARDAERAAQGGELGTAGSDLLRGEGRALPKTQEGVSDAGIVDSIPILGSLFRFAGGAVEDAGAGREMHDATANKTMPGNLERLPSDAMDKAGDDLLGYIKGLLGLTGDGAQLTKEVYQKQFGRRVKDGLKDTKRKGVGKK